MKKITGFVFLTLFFLTLEIHANDLDWAIKTCAPKVHETTMKALIKVESGGNVFAISDDGNMDLPRGKRVSKSYFPNSKEDAVRIAHELIKRGHIVGMGLGQIINSNRVALGMTVEDMFDACKNLGASQAILLDNYSRAANRYGPGDKALVSALSAYNSGNFVTGINNGYVAKVVGASKLSVPALKYGSQNGLAVFNRKRPGYRQAKKDQLLAAKFASIEVDKF